MEDFEEGCERGPALYGAVNKRFLSTEETRELAPDKVGFGLNRPLVFPVPLFASRLLPAPEIPGTMSKPSERPGSTKAGQFLGHDGVFQGGWDSLDSGLAGVGIIGAGSRRGYGSTRRQPAAISNAEHASPRKPLDLN
jgi:hypothetical protein